MSDWIAADWPAPKTIVAGTTLRTGDASALPLLGQPCWLNQVHGSTVVAAGSYDEAPEADASVKGPDPFWCAVRTADCLPVLVCSEDGGVFGAAHAGWRGLAAGVIENTVALLDHDPSNLLVWLGPAISQPSFEVGDEVRAAFVAHDASAGACFAANTRGRWQADLYGLARQRLTSVGVSQVYGGGFCTFLDDKRFYSYRRNPDCGRLVSFVGLRAP
jgi:YfiH family protein